MIRTRFGFGGLVCTLLAITACGAQVDAPSDGSSVGEQTFALTTAESVLGFESTQVWSVTSGTLASTTVHSQGSAAVSVTPNGFAQLTSVPLSTLGGTTSTLSLDVRRAEASCARLCAGSDRGGPGRPAHRDRHRADLRPAELVE